MTGSDTHREAVEAMIGAIQAALRDQLAGGAGLRLTRRTKSTTSRSDSARAVSSDLQEAAEDAAVALAAVPADVLARLAVERGGLENVGWVYATEQRMDLRYTLCRDEPTAHRHREPVYRIVEATDD